MVDIIELLNEGGGFRGPNWVDTIRQYFLDGYNTIRTVEPNSGSPLGVMIGDAFQTLQPWNGFLTSPQAHNVLMDTHAYQIFSDGELNRTFPDHVSFACSTLLPSYFSYASSNIWTVLGEWSTALTDCAKWLNGRGVGARWDNSGVASDTSIFHGSCDGWTGSWNGTDGGKVFSDDYKNTLRQYWELQVEIGEAVQGWVYWTWKVRFTIPDHHCSSLTDVYHADRNRRRMELSDGLGRWLDPTGPN